VRQTVHSDAIRNTETTALRGSLIYQFDPQLRATALAGWETNNYAAAGSQSAATYGARIEWMPTDRTVASAQKEWRPFANSHEFTFRHHTQLTAWHLSDRKSTTTLPNQLAEGRTGTAFDLLFNALTAQFPDPVERAREVERRLQQSGIPRDLALATQFLTTRVLVQRSRQASVSLLGARNTVTLAAAMVDSAAVDAGTTTSDDFARSANIRQRSISVNWAHQLSGYSSLNLLTAHVRSSAGSGVGVESSQSIARLEFTQQLGQKTFGTVGARYVRFDGPSTSDFREKAITASVLITF
jgi:uncharacterized protein (PEP-CTERM system associated)